MRNEEVLYFIERLKERTPLIERVRREHFPETDTLSSAHRRWYANRDAAVAWHLTSAYYDKGQKLPTGIGWFAAQRPCQPVSPVIGGRPAFPLSFKVSAISAALE
jgi:hypothetical protein